MDNDTEDTSHVSSGEDDLHHKESRFDKRSRSPYASTDSWSRQERGVLLQKHDMRASSAYQRSLFRVRSRRPGAAHVEAGANEQRRQTSPHTFSRARGIFPRMTQVSHSRKEGTSRYPRDSGRDTTFQHESASLTSRNPPNHETISSEAKDDRQISRNSSERVRRQLPQSPVHDSTRSYGRGQTRIVKSRTWDEDRNRPTIRDETEGELDGFFRFVGSLSCASWHLLTRIPDALSQVPGLTIQLLEHIIPCFGRPRNLVTDE